ncbi:MAG: hypothetical protein M1482_14490 [Chloroflexi bacterium]|nr:hypothetical protein [Chloroflexota bacterium]
MAVMTDPARRFAVGDIVVVSGPPGEVIGEVLDASTPDEMPDLGPGSCSKEAKDAMREQKVDLILLMGHQHDDQQVCFFAVHNPNGWTDLHGQKLTVLKGYAVEVPLTTEN